MHFTYSRCWYILQSFIHSFRLSYAVIVHWVICQVLGIEVGARLSLPPKLQSNWQCQLMKFDDTSNWMKVCSWMMIDLSLSVNTIQICFLPIETSSKEIIIFVMLWHKINMDMPWVPSNILQWNYLIWTGNTPELSAQKM